MQLDLPWRVGREVMVPATSQEHLYSTLTQSLTDRNAYLSQISVERGDSNKVSYLNTCSCIIVEERNI